MNLDLLPQIFTGANSILIFGARGLGKSHMVIRIIHELLKLKKYRILTNIKFKMRIAEPPYFKESYPEGIIHVQYYSEIFRRAAEIKVKEPDAIIVVWWDEMAKTLSNYDWGTKFGKMMVRTLADTRKIDLCICAISQQKKDFPLKLREFFGNVEIFKNRNLTRKYNLEHGTEYTPQQLAFIIADLDCGAVRDVWIIDSCPWTKPKQECKLGEIIYDHRSSTAIIFDDYWEDPKIGPKLIKAFAYAYSHIEEELAQSLLDFFVEVDRVVAALEMEEGDDDPEMQGVDLQEAALRYMFRLYPKGGAVKGIIKEPSRRKSDLGTIEINEAFIERMLQIPDSTFRRRWEQFEREAGHHPPPAPGLSIKGGPVSPARAPESGEGSPPPMEDHPDGSPAVPAG
jgi:hypothetical protein